MAPTSCFCNGFTVVVSTIKYISINS
jgi:hypothetical protein